MIIRYTRDDRENWCDDIGRIESSSHPYFYHRVFTATLSEVEKSKQSTSLIIWESSIVCDDLLSKSDKISLWYLSIFSLKSLSYIDIVWTRINSYLFPWFLEHLEYHLRDTSLPIGSCYMYGFEFVLWVPEIFTCECDLFERVLSDLFGMEKIFEDGLVLILQRSFKITSLALPWFFSLLHYSILLLLS